MLEGGVSGWWWWGGEPATAQVILSDDSGDGRVNDIDDMVGWCGMGDAMCAEDGSGR